MKKIIYTYMRAILFILIIWLVALIPSAQTRSIKVIYPNGGEKLLVNTPVTIKWQSEDKSEKVVIVLYKQGIKKFTINKGCDNTGHYIWNIPANFPQGKKYRLRIRLLGDLAVNDFSDRDFQIKEKRK